MEWEDIDCLFAKSPVCYGTVSVKYRLIFNDDGWKADGKTGGGNW